MAETQREEFLNRFAGKVAVIAGGNSGTGLAPAKRFADEGAKVAISGRSQQPLGEAVKTIGNGVLAVKADVSVLADLDRFYATVAQKFGKIDILFANAGVAKFAPLDQSTEALYDERFDINSKGLFFTVQKALPHLRDGGSIIFISSVVDDKGIDQDVVYEASTCACGAF